MNDLILYGCRTKPLSSYLKAVGILRLISEQKDPKAKGWWQGEKFACRSVLNQEEFEKFFCDEYAPTPIIAPWNGGSGFYIGDMVDGIKSISASNQERFSAYRKVISEIQSWPEVPAFETVDEVRFSLQNSLNSMGTGKKKEEMETMLSNIESTAPKIDGEGKKSIMHLSLFEVEALSKQKGSPENDSWKAWWNLIKKARTKCNEIARKENKRSILPRCRARLPESCVQWLDAVFALQTDGQGKFNALLGTGGNEGRFEFSNNFMQRLVELFIRDDPQKRRNFFKSAAFDASMPGLINAKIGQYDPGRAGGYNQGVGVETKDFKINPWDFILALEGALLMSSAAVRRNPTDERSQMTSPFCVRFSPVGFSSSTGEETGRQELWLPIWREPAHYGELKYLFGEGRSTIGKKVTRSGLEFSRAVGTLGVDRGIESFERYAFLERRGKSYVALPAGRIRSFYKPKLELINELDPILLTADRFLRAFPNVPATFQSVRQNIDEAIFKCCQVPDSDNFSTLIRTIGRLEKLIAIRDRSKKPTLDRPLYGLSPLWIDFCDDNKIEVRIAAALASIRATGKVGPLRSNMAEIDPISPWKWSDGKGDRNWIGGSLSDRLASAFSRRLIDAERRSAPNIPVEAFLSVSPQDVTSYLWGECYDTKIEDLLWGFTLINWKRPTYKEPLIRWKTPLSDYPLSRGWCLLKLLHSPHKIRDVKVKLEPRILHLLLAGRLSEACEVAIHRLRVSDLSPYPVSYQEALDPIRLLSSLVIPVRDQWKLEHLVLKKKNQNP